MINIVEKSNENLIVLDISSRLLQDRIISLTGYIDSDLTNRVIDQLTYLDSLNNNPISIYINSFGGQVTQGLAIYDFVKILKSPVRTICIGEAYSMAAVLMLMGTERIAMKHSRFMFHQIRGGSIGTLKEMQLSLKEAEDLQNEIYTIIKEHTSVTNPEKDLLFDKWMNAKEALECGLVTEIK